jgi:hypothetical protein
MIQGLSRIVRPFFFYRRIKPMTSKRMIAPMTALMISPSVPPPIAMPSRGRSHPAMSAPTIPTRILPIIPNP